MNESPSTGDSGGPFKYKRHQDCPDRAKHTKAPEGYLQWHDWADRKQRTHDCERCPTCGYWTIWKRRKAA